MLARKTPLRKPNRGEGIISTKPRRKSVMIMIFLVYCIVSLSGQRQSWKTPPPDELGVSKSLECDIFPSILLVG